MQNSSTEDASFLSALEFMISQQQQQNSQSLPNQGLANLNASPNMNPSLVMNPNASMGKMIGQPGAVMAPTGMVNLKPPGIMQNRLMQQSQSQQFNSANRIQNPTAQDPDVLKALFSMPQASGQQPTLSVQMQQQQVAAMRQIIQQQQQQKQIQNIQNMQNAGVDPSIQQALGALLMNANAPNKQGQQLMADPNLATPQDSIMDWRITMSQQERIQFIIRLGKEVMNIVPHEQRSDNRISNLAKTLEKQIYDKSISKAQYMLNLKNQIDEIQKKAQSNTIGSNDMSSPNGKSDQVIPPSVADSQNLGSQINLPTILSLSEQEKAMVNEKITQILPLHAKLDILMRTLAQLGGSAEMDKLRRLASIKKVIDMQLEGFPIGRYTISPDVANGLYPNLVRFFQYGDALVKQKQQIDEKTKMGTFGMGPPMKAATAPQMQPNQHNQTQLALGCIPAQMLSNSQIGNVNQGSAKANALTAGGQAPSNPQLLQLQQKSIQQMQLAAQKRQQQFLAKLSAQKQLRQGGGFQRESSLQVPLTELHDLFADPTSPIATSGVSERLTSSSPLSPNRLLGEEIAQFFNLDDATDPSLLANLPDQSYDYPSSHTSGQSTVKTPTSPRKRKAPEATANENPEQSSDMIVKRPKKNPSKKHNNGSPSTLTVSPTSPFTPRMHPLNKELEDLKTKFGVEFDIIDVETLIPSSLKSVSGSPLSPTPSFQSLFLNGKVLVLCGMKGSKVPLVRLAFRLSSRAEYHQSFVVRAHHQQLQRHQESLNATNESSASPVSDTQSSATNTLFNHNSRSEVPPADQTGLEAPIWDYRFSTCGLEEIEVLGGDTNEVLNDIRSQIENLSVKLGVGFMGNTVKISDVVTFLADKV